MFVTRFKNSCARFLSYTIIGLSFMSCNWLPGDYQVYDEPSQAFQAVGGTSELWLFLQHRRVMCRPFDPRDFIFFSDTPKCEQVNRYQEVVVLNRTGLVRRISILNGVTFQAVISNIFVVNNDFYIFKSESMGEYASLFRWKEDHFELVPIDEADDVLGEDLNEKNIEAHMKTSEWQVLVLSLGSDYQASFSWNDENFSIVVEENEESFSVIIKNMSNSRYDPIILSYNRNREIVNRGGEKLLNELTESYINSQQRGHVKPEFK